MSRADGQAAMEGRVGRSQAPLESMAPSQLGAADRASVIYQAVHQAVTEQRLLPGTKLSEDQIGGIFGASRTLVRTALQSLAREGMVVLARNRGAFVASPGVREAGDLFDARRVLEAVTTARAAAQAAPADIAALQVILEEGREALAAGDRGRAIRFSGSFHLRIAEISGQTVLESFLKELVARSSLVIALYGHAGRSDCGDAEHQDLIDALRRADAPGAVALMDEHIRHIEADLDFTRSGRASVPLVEVFRSDGAVSPLRDLRLTLPIES